MQILTFDKFYFNDNMFSAPGKITCKLKKRSSAICEPCEYVLDYEYEI